MFFASQVLETITQDSARVILTGQAQSGQLPACATTCTSAQQFKNYVCTKIPALFDCNSLSVDVQSYNTSFGSVSLSNHMDSACNFDASTMQYNPGATGQVTVVRLFYQWPLFVTRLGYNIGCGNSNKRLLVATAAFKNEPY
jgi:Flp pilus assembly protein TadG